jgi:hypothetical protein
LTAFIEPYEISFLAINSARQLNALRDHQGPLDTPLGLSDVKAMFLEVKEYRGLTVSKLRALK